MGDGRVSAFPSLLFGHCLIIIYAYPAFTGRALFGRWQGRRWFRGSDPIGWSRGMVLIGLGICVSASAALWPPATWSINVVVTALSLLLLVIGVIVLVLGWRRAA